MADDAIDYIDRMNTLTPDQPFFVYYVPGGLPTIHSELHFSCQSWRSAPAGSISKTRAAGTALAIAAIASKKNAAPVKVTGSTGETPNSRPLVSLCDAHAPNSPMTAPNAAISRACFSTNQRTLIRLAPNAIRTAISCLRCATRKETTP